MADDKKKDRFWQVAKWAIPTLIALGAWLYSDLTPQEVWGWITATYAAVGYPATFLPPWLLTGIVMVAVSLAAVAREIERRRRQEPEARERYIDVKKYTGTFLLGVAWTWKWHSLHDNTIINLRALCPKCLHRLHEIHHEIFDPDAPNARCPNCGFKTRLAVNSAEEVKDLIHKHRRTEEYKDRVKEFEKRKEEIRQKEANKPSE